MNDLFWHSPFLFWQKFGLIALYAITAWAILAPFYMIIVYYLLLPAFRRIKRLKIEATNPPVQP